MDFLLNRYRNLTVLLIVIVAQLLLLAYQVKTNRDVPLMRAWAVSTVTPVEEGLEFVRRHTIGLAGDYFDLVHVRETNDKMQHDLDRLKLENHYLRSELSTADRAKELNAFRQQTPSKTLAARTIGNGTGANSKTIFIDRGTSGGVENGMAVITPDGIVGKVVAAYPRASLVMLMTDSSFAAGVVSQKNHVHGTLKGLGGPKCRVDYVQNEEKVDTGEWFYSSGDDGIFPRGFPVGQIASVQNGRTSKEIIVTPSGWQGGLDEVLIVTEGVHQQIPERPIAAAPVKILPPPADQSTAGISQNTAALATDADKLRQEYKQIGEQEKIQYGASGTKPPDFTKVGKPAAPAPPPAQAQATGQAQPGATPGATAPAGSAAKPPLNPGTATASGPILKTPSTPGTVNGTAPGSAGRSPSTPGISTATGPALKPPSAPGTVTGTAQKQPSTLGATTAPGSAGRSPSTLGGTTAAGPGLKPLSTPGTATGATTAPGSAGRSPSTLGGTTAAGPGLKPPSTPGTVTGATTAPGSAGRSPSTPGGTTGAGPALKLPSASGTHNGSVPATAGSTQPNSQRTAASPGSQTGAVSQKPKSRPPILETDPTDADPANEAVVERIQRERSNARALSEDKNTEILPSVPAPKTKPAMPKAAPPRTPGPATGTARTGPAAP